MVMTFTVKNVFEKKNEKNLVCETVVWSLVDQSKTWLKNMTRSVGQWYGHWWVKMKKLFNYMMMCSHTQQPQRWLFEGAKMGSVWAFWIFTRFGPIQVPLVCQIRSGFVWKKFRLEWWNGKLGTHVCFKFEHTTSLHWNTKTVVMLQKMSE